jgi:hypothetical protein
LKNKTIIATITIGVIAATLIAAATVVPTNADATALDKIKKTIEKHKKSPQNVQDVAKKFGDACLSCW